MTSETDNPTALMSFPETLQDPSWYLDSGASNYVTADYGKLSLKVLPNSPVLPPSPSLTINTSTPSTSPMHTTEPSSPTHISNFSHLSTTHPPSSGTSLFTPLPTPPSQHHTPPSLSFTYPTSSSQPYLSPLNPHAMVTRAKFGIFKPKRPFSGLTQLSPA
ncbi:unnamed protein product [Citrullus colocynthis]|uniref:Uncharacterized protein n=1 Tax=Citrullus colocynthis TaxID=252529 RepID=A0ABP0Y0V5_9ROSI